ncbi:MAG: hypothetical protein ABSA93_39025 [Streptosporangiaceae bacterium]|jgi:hypothetical protein
MGPQEWMVTGGEPERVRLVDGVVVLAGAVTAASCPRLSACIADRADEEWVRWLEVIVAWNTVTGDRGAPS